MAGFDNDVLYADNVDFTGTSPVSGQINQDGELLVGSSVAPYIRSYVPTGSSGVSIGTGAGTIDFSLANVPNSALSNSSITLGEGTNITITGSPVALGGIATIDVKGPPSATNLTNHGVLLGRANSAITAASVGTTGTLLVGATGADPAFSASAVGDFTFTSATAGATRLFTVSNSDNTNAASNATIQALTGGASAGDARYSASTTTTEWSFGVDNSVTAPTADPFVISQGAALGTNNIMSVATSGEINYPLQPSFQARATLQSNVTGDGTTYTLTFTSVIFDQNSDFDGTSTFTAPVTGKYFLYCNLSVGGVLSTHTTGTLSIVTTGRTYNYTFDPAKTFDVNTNVSAQLTALADMTAGNTAICQIKISNGTKVVDINTATNTYFCGFLQA